MEISYSFSLKDNKVRYIEFRKRSVPAIDKKLKAMKITELAE